MLTRKQASVVFANYKNGNLKANESVIRFMYNSLLEGKYVNPYNRNMIDENVSDMQNIISCLINKDYEKANELLVRDFGFLLK